MMGFTEEDTMDFPEGPELLATAHRGEPRSGAADGEGQGAQHPRQDFQQGEADADPLDFDDYDYEALGSRGKQTRDAQDGADDGGAAEPSGDVARAAAYGIPESVAGAMDPDALAQTLAGLDGRLMMGFAPAGGAPFAGAQPNQPAAPPAPKKIDFKKYEIPAGELAEYDPAIVKHITGMNDHYSSLVEGLASQVAEITSGIAARETQESEASFDSFIDGLGNEWAPVFGAGSTRGLPPHSPALQARIRVLAAADALTSSYQRYGIPVPKQEEVLNRALQAEFASHAHKVRQQKQNQQTRDQRSGRFTRRPLSKRPPAAGGPRRELTGEQRAVQNLASKMRDRGLLD